MLYYMSSKTFFELYLHNEKDKDILEAQYVCVSSQIYRKDISVTNIICPGKILYPDNSVFNLGSFEDMEDAYREQLSDNAMPLLAEIVRGSLEDKLNIIFLCTKAEWKLKYIKWLAEFIMDKFEYPIYNYKKYIEGEPLYEYDKEKVLKIIKPILVDAKERLYEENRQSKTGRKRIIQDYKEMSKKELKKICKDKDLYYDGMSKEEMLDILETFL